MNEILDNYKLFSVIFITVLLIVMVIYKFLFEMDEIADDSEKLNSHTKKGEIATLPESDEKIFQKFNRLLPPAGGSIFFLRNSNMTMVFHKRGLDGLYTFYEACKNGEYRFSDESLERLKNELYHAVEQYLLTFELNSKETSSGYYKVCYNIDGLHLQVDDLLKKYDIFSAAAKKKLL
jgi:hypothetical protein